MKFTGHFYNPEYAGEGFIMHEMGNGDVYCYFFTFGIDGMPRWMEAEGRRDGDMARLDVGIWSSGRMGDSEALKNRERLGYGTIILTDKGDKLHMRFVGVREFAYDLYPLYGTADPLEPTPQPEPEPVPEPEPIDFGVKLEKKIGKDKWTEIQIPLERRRIFPDSVHRLTALRDVTITEAYGKGQFNPKIHGVRKGDKLMTGESVEITYSLKDGWDEGTGPWDWVAWFGLHVDGNVVIDGAVQASRHE